MSGFKTAVVGVVAAGALACAGPAAAENLVRWATPLPADSFDPYGHDELITIRGQNLVFESLTNYDRQGRLEPGLAVSWKWLDARTRRAATLV